MMQPAQDAEDAMPHLVATGHALREDVPTPKQRRKLKPTAASNDAPPVLPAAEPLLITTGHALR